MILNTFGRMLRKFTEPIRTHSKLILVITIGVFLPCVYAEIRLTQLVQRNADDNLMLLCEAATDPGDNFATARKDHANMLEYYIGHMERRPLSRLLRLLYPELSPEVQLRPVLEFLRDEQGEARAEIEAAAKVINQFVRNSQQSSDLPLMTSSCDVLPEQLLEVNDAIDKSQETVKKYEETPTVDNAEKACRANRRAIALIYLVRFEYENLGDEKLKQFRHDIDRTIYYNGCSGSRP